MGSSVLLTPQQKKFQLQLIFVFFFLVSLFVFADEAYLALCQATAQAVVVGYEDVYDSHGASYPGQRIVYQYFDTGTKIVRRENYWLPGNSPMPPLGQRFDVEYLPDVGGLPHIRWARRV